MKVTFEFDTSSENFDKYELERHYQCNDLADCIARITDQLRNWIKWDERESIPTDEIHKKIWDIIEESVSMERLGF